MLHFDGEDYLDDRIFVLDVGRAIISSSDPNAYRGVIWSVTTSRNTRLRPPFRVDEFHTREEAIAFLEKVEPTTPRISLGGRSPDRVPSIEEYQAWLRASGLRPAWVEPEPSKKGAAYELYTGKRLENRTHIRESRKKRLRLDRSYYLMSVGQEGREKLRFNMRPAAKYALYWRIEPYISAPRFALIIQKAVDAGAHPMPWAIICLDRTYRLMAHFLSTRGSRDQMIGSCHTVVPGTEPDKLSLIYVFTREGLGEAAEKSVLYQQSWEVLRNKRKDRMWLCLPARLPKSWVDATETGDEIAETTYETDAHANTKLQE
jgi:hypothetical protein